MRRRTFLRSLAALGITPYVGSGATEASAADRRLAAMGAVLQRRRPVVARALLRAAGARPPASPAAVRATWLDGERVRGDFARGDVVTIDGWVVARSEAVAAVVMHGLLPSTSASP